MCLCYVVIYFDLYFLYFLLQDGAKFVKKIKGIFVFKVKGGPGGKEGVWVVDVKNGNGSVKFDPNGKCTFCIAYKYIWHI